jgi:hypothetical protein
MKVLYAGETGIMIALCYHFHRGHEASIVKLRGTQAVVLQRSGALGNTTDAVGKLLDDTMTRLYNKLKADNPELEL